MDNTMTKFEEKAIMAPHRIEAFNEVHSNIRYLNEGISKAMDLSAIRMDFENHAELLKQKEKKLLDTVRKLELTKNTLVEEVHFRESEEVRLNQLISEMRSQKSEIEAKLFGYEADVRSLQTEKEKLDALLARMKSVIAEMHEKVKEFHQILRSE